MSELNKRERTDSLMNSSNYNCWVMVLNAHDRSLKSAWTGEFKKDTHNYTIHTKIYNAHLFDAFFLLWLV